MGTFDVEAFVAACIDARGEGDAVAAIAEIVERAVASPGAVERAFEFPLDPDDDGILHRADDLCIVSGIFPAGFVTGIHDHRMAAVIGVWGGFEDNRLYARGTDGLVRQSARRVQEREVLVLPADAVHDVHAPSTRWTGALHVYLGDLLGVDRSQWADESDEERSFSEDRFEDRWLELALATGLARAPET